jgi:hypothetical protein
VPNISSAVYNCEFMNESSVPYTSISFREDSGVTLIPNIGKVHLLARSY